MNAPQDSELTDEAWRSVLDAVDRTYSDLVSYQQQLESQNKELQDAQQLIDSVLGSVSDLMLVIGRDGRIEEASASVSAIAGGADVSVTGAPLPSLFAPGDSARIETAFGELRFSRAVRRLEARIQTPEGPEPYDLSLSPRLDGRGRLVGAVVMGRPLGELRRAYSELEISHEQLKDAQAQLVRNEKLASLGRLLAGVAHELNNPISFVYASVHALEKYVGQFETYFERVQAGAPRAELVALREKLKLERNLSNLVTAIHGAREGAERVRDIVADLRRLSSDGPGEPVEFDLVTTARVAASWVERGSKCGIGVGYDGPAALAVRGVPGQVQQIVMNLVQNAIDAAAGQAAPQVRLSLSATDGTARLSVHDNGPGVPEAIRTQVFDPFFTTKPVGQGTGLGLSISSKIADEHGGRLLVGPGPGGHFILELPLGPAAEDA